MECDCGVPGVVEVEEEAMEQDEAGDASDMAACMSIDSLADFAMLPDDVLSVAAALGAAAKRDEGGGGGGGEWNSVRLVAVLRPIFSADPPASFAAEAAASRRWHLPGLRYSGRCEAPRQDAMMPSRVVQPYVVVQGSLYLQCVLL